MTHATWRQMARASLDKALSAAREQGLEGAALEKALYDSYPFGERAYTPYRVWCEERRKILCGWQSKSEAKRSAAEDREREKIAAWGRGEPIK